MMFFDGNTFWFLFGVIFVVIAFAFKAFAEDRGWIMSWWKWLLTSLWYLLFIMTIYAWGTLTGEGFSGAGFNTFLFGGFICLILGVGLWRLLGLKPKEA